MFEQKAISFLDRNSVMAIASVRPDGWPQATMVAYGNDGLTVFFMISRMSQKFLNMERDDRVSIAIGSPGSHPTEISGLSMAARASEVRDEPYRSSFCAQLAARHPDYFAPDAIDFKHSALMRAQPTTISIIDFSRGLGHADTISVGPGNLGFIEPARPDGWGFNPEGSASRS